MKKPCDAPDCRHSKKKRLFPKIVLVSYFPFKKYCIFSNCKIYNIKYTIYPLGVPGRRQVYYKSTRKRTDARPNFFFSPLQLLQFFHEYISIIFFKFIVVNSEGHACLYRWKFHNFNKKPVSTGHRLLQVGRQFLSYCINVH
jgi:hypothetical protein